MKKLIIAGGTGFLGSVIISYFKDSFAPAGWQAGKHHQRQLQNSDLGCQNHR